MEEMMRKIISTWFEEGSINSFLGFRSQTPLLITDPQDIDRLQFNEKSLCNLATLLSTDITADEENKRGVILKGCDGRAVVQLIAEGRIKRENLKILGIKCTGMMKGERPADKCRYCENRIPPVYDTLVEMNSALKVEPVITDEQMGNVESKSQEERAAFFREQFSKCIRCYACREACPLCYCDDCITEKNKPQWIERSIKPSSNTYWNLIRAFHLAGRCVECGECDRVCPVGIPLRLLNKKMAMETEKHFHYKAGMDTEKRPALFEYKAEE